ncbi:MAG: hypothetical protein F6K56_31045 [Moorea sp. SIO3G5]|nr:hypothetical protein [Moorena sp. SIO3G5]
MSVILCSLFPDPLFPAPCSQIRCSLENAIDLTANWYNFPKIAKLKTVQAL